MRAVYATAIRLWAKRAADRKRRYDAAMKPVTFELGDKVLVHGESNLLRAERQMEASLKGTLSCCEAARAR
jgi:hypothetical protein